MLERFHDSEDMGVKTVGDAMAAAEESWVEAGYDSMDEMSQALSEGKEILARHIEAHAVNPVTTETLFVEKLFQKDMGEYILVGRMDRVDEHENGTIEVVDYKSGRSSVSESDVRDDLAMGCYQLLLRHHYPDAKVVASIIALKTGKKASYSFADQELSEFEGLLNSLATEVLNREYTEIEPVPKPLCLSCDFRSLCLKYPEFSLSEFDLPEPAQS